MVYKFGLICCDAANYIWLANECGSKGECWSEMRPVGMALYSAIPVVIWKNVEYMVLMNMLMVGATALLLALALGSLFPGLKGFFGFLLRLGLSSAACAAFMWGDVKTPLSDIPSAAFALWGVSFYAMGAAKKSNGLMGLGGLCLGTAAFVRVFYLYPALLTLAAVAWLGVRKKVFNRNGALAFAYGLLLPILSQYAITHHHSGKWSYLASRSEKEVTSLHFSWPMWGWDTKVTAAGAEGIRYEGGCLKGPDGLAGGIRTGDWSGIACFLGQRYHFYFGSYLGHSYIADTSERVFSKWILIANLAAILLAFAAWRAGGWSLFFPMLFMLANSGMAVMVVPESRFMMATYVFVWCVGAGYALSRLFGRSGRAAADAAA